MRYVPLTASFRARDRELDEPASLLIQHRAVKPCDPLSFRGATAPVRISFCFFSFKPSAIFPVPDQSVEPQESGKTAYSRRLFQLYNDVRRGMCHI